MPKSKRDRKVALSKVTKKVGLNFKQELIDKIRSAVDEYDRLFVFTVDNMRNQGSILQNSILAENISVKFSL
jgi:mRNA turnover protein 4